MADAAFEVLDPQLIKIKNILTLFALIEGGFVKRFIKTFNTTPHLDISAHPVRDSRPGYEGWTLLHHAALLGDVRVVAFLVEKGHPIDIIESSISKQTPLMIAITHNNVDVAKELVMLGADPSLTDFRGENAIHYAARVSGIMIKEIIRVGNFSRDQIAALMTATNAKKKFPEDLSASDIVKETLVQFRAFGYIPKKIRNLPSKKRSNPLLVA